MWFKYIKRIIFFKYVGVSNVVNNNLLFLCVYAGLVLCVVPSIYCSSGISRVLTYENIFNVTKYPQVQYQSRPFQTRNQYELGNVQPNIKSAKEAQAQRNEVDYEYKDDDVNTADGADNALLIGLSHDPFRISVPENEYIKDVSTLNPLYYNKGDRGKRGVVHLYNMIHCATGCDPISYKGYGCYCGFLGAGRPMDGIDRCCQMHDRCYENIRCPFYTVYFQPYYWKCYHGQPLCALENYKTRQNYINGCAGRLCECDRRFAMCLQRYRCPRGRALCTSQPLRLLQNLLMFP